MGNDFSWRIPLILQSFACVIVIGAVFFIPESPRFLMANGREEEAIAFLVKYHGNGDPNSKLVKLEVDEMREGIRQDGIDKTWWDYRPFLLSHSSRWRFAQVIMISVFGQFSGNGLGYFNTAIFKGLGVTSVPQQLGYNILNQALSAIGALTAVSLTDRMPRRKVLVIGTFACAVALALNSGLSAALDQQQRDGGGINISYGQAALASYFLFNIIFSFTYTPLQGVIPTEALETTTRAKGLALSGFIVNALGFVNQFAGPIALENIQYRYIFVFVGWDWYVVPTLRVPQEPRAKQCLPNPGSPIRTIWLILLISIEALAWYFFGYVVFSVSQYFSAEANVACPQRRVTRPYTRAARVGLQPAQPGQGVSEGRQGHYHRRWKGCREDYCVGAYHNP
jgi:hypothetical protein